MHSVAPVRAVVPLNRRSLRLVALLVLWLRPEKATSSI